MHKYNNQEDSNHITDLNRYLWVHSCIPMHVATISINPQACCTCVRKVRDYKYVVTYNKIYLKFCAIFFSL